MALADGSAPQSILERLRGLNPLFLSALVLAFAPIWQLRFGTNTDTSWIITLCERVLAGERLYIDLIETNPPFTVWMFMPPVALAKWIRIAPEIAIHVYAYAACVAGLWLAAAIVRRAELPEQKGLLAILPVFVALLVLLPGGAFSEREQFGIALLLPLLALMAWRTNALAFPGIGWAMAAGLCGSVIVLIKPYYALMIVVPALWVAWRRKSPWVLFVAEYWVIGAVCVAYIVAVATFHPEFLTDIYPLVRDTYMRFRQPVQVMMFYGPIFGFVALLIYYFHRGRKLSPLTVISLLAATAGLIPLVYQGKGWAYHAYPAMTLYLSVLGYSAWQKFNSTGEGRPSLVSVVPLAATFIVAAMPFTLHYKSPGAMIETVRNAAPTNPSIAVIGGGIEVGHPFTRRVGGRWIGSYCSDWLGEFALVWKMVNGQDGRTETLPRYNAIVEDYSRAKAEQMRAANPDIVLVQKEDSIWTDPFLARQDMAGFMDRYELLTEDEGMWVYLLKPELRG